mmetsp:Transcript_8997/g.33964  ORF Transcript_8997/g.33964 Transcript_8997/m.33964 type:complete len:372 (+) Transcript_8997:64-1179(+)
MRIAALLLLLSGADALARPRLFYGPTRSQPRFSVQNAKVQVLKGRKLLIPTLSWLVATPLEALASSRDVPLVKPGEVEVVLSLFFASVCGAFIGMERRNSERPAGVRTMSLVAMGSCIFGIISRYGFNPADRSRVAASVASGVGFIGAGVITRLDNPTGSINIKGLTTASTIWIAAAVGLACGCGLFFTAFTSTAITLFVLRSNRFRRRLADRLRAWVGASEQKPKKKKKTSSKVVVAHPVRYSDVKGSANGKMPPTAPASALQEALAAVEAAKRVADAVDASIESISDSNVRSKVLDATQAALEVAETAAKEARQRVDAAEAPTPAAPTPAAPSGVAQVGGDETLATVKKAREATDDYHARMEDYRQRME